MKSISPTRRTSGQRARLDSKGSKFESGEAQTKIFFYTLLFESFEPNLHFCKLSGTQTDPGYLQVILNTHIV